MSRKCPACGNTQNSIIRKIQMELPAELHLPAQYNVVSCERCGLCYADTSARLEDYDHYYMTHNSYSGNSAGIASITVSYIEKFLERHMGGAKSLRILDVGFGKGDLLLHLRQLGYANLAGIDPSPFSVNHLRELGIDAYCGSVYCPPSEMDELKGSMDVVLLTTVLEHLLEPKRAINIIGEYLKKGGYLIIDIPDYSLCHKIVLPVPNQFNQEHINYFSESSFRALLLDTDFQIYYSQPTEVKNADEPGCDFCTIFFCQKCSNRKETGELIEKDTCTKKAIESYFLQQEKHQHETRELIKRLYEEQAQIIIWGTGAMAMTLLASTDLPKCEIVAFVDGNLLKIGSEIAGRKIDSPDVIYDYPNAVIVICAMKYAHEIKERIVAMGVENKVIEV